MVIGGTELLCAPVGEFDLEVSFVGEDVCESAELTVGEPVGGAAQNVADPVERIVLSAAMAVEILLDPATDLVDGLGAELHDMKGVQHRPRVV